MKSEIELPALDGSNPLAFMAALGVLASLRRQTERSGTCEPTLRWADNGRWIPVVRSHLPQEDLIDCLLDEQLAWGNEAVLSLAYKGAEPCEPESKGAELDLKPSPAVFRAFASELISQCADESRSVHHLAALASEMCVDGGGKLKPTALHFTAGQQQFLRMVRELRVRVAAVDYEEALFGPWTGASRLPSLSWDASAVRVYAHRASDPSKQKRGSIAAANWLAFVGLMFIPVAAHHGRLLTACTAGSWKHGSFRWPIWTGAATEGAARSLLQSPLPADAAARRARGIEVVFESTISRSDQGGYGAFSPASPS